MALSLQNREWKEFFIQDIFTIKSGVRLTKSLMMEGNMPFIGATDSNNGITNFISNANKSIDSNVLGVNYNGSVVENFYHPYKAIFSDDVKRLTIKNRESNKYMYLFIKTAILKQKVKYQYAYKFNGERMSRQLIMLPVESNGKPDYTFMEQYMREREAIQISKYKSHIAQRIDKIDDIHDVEPLTAKRWKDFVIKEVFNTNKGVYLHQNKITKGDTAYITAKSENNGINSFIGNKSLFDGNCITIEKINFSAYYQREPFYCSHDVSVLTHELLNKYNALFICSMVNRQGYKYSYGRQAQLNVVSKERILLPISDDDTPDFQYMEQYIKALEYKKLKSYLDWK